MSLARVQTDSRVNTFVQKPLSDAKVIASVSLGWLGANHEMNPPQTEPTPTQPPAPRTAISTRLTKRQAPQPRGEGPPVMLVMAPGTVIRANAGQLSLERDNELAVRVHPGRLRGLVVGNSVGMSTHALGLLSEHGCSFVQLGGDGAIRCVLHPPTADSGELLLGQAALEVDRRSGGGRALGIARKLVELRIRAMDALLAQHERSHAESNATDALTLGAARRELASWLARLPHVDSMDELRGAEGASSAAYWRCMGVMLTGVLRTERRSRRPPRDPVNAMLSFGYSLLCAETAGAVVAQRLAPGLGLLHTPQGSTRPSLALDLMEPLRISIIDRLVIALCNRGQMTAQHFEQPTGEPSEAVWLTAEGRRVFLSAYQTAMGSLTQLEDGTQCSTRCLIDRTVRWFIEHLVEAVAE